MARWAAEESEAGDPIDYLQAAAALNLYDASAWIGSVDVPTAVIVTTRDTTVRPERQRAMAAAIPAAMVLDVDGPHRACVESAGEFVPALIRACRNVSPAAAAGPEPAGPAGAPGQVRTGAPAIGPGEARPARKRA